MSLPLQLLSCGLGVQSSTLALMAAQNGLLRADAAIFSDTRVEPAAVYEWKKWLESKLSFPLYTVSAGDLGADSTTLRTSKKTGNTYARSLIPAFVAKPDGSRAILGRKCTAEYKVRAILRKARELVAAWMGPWRKKHRLAIAEFRAAQKQKRACESWARTELENDPLVVQWIGISTDEAHRMKPSREPWCVVRWPLIELGMSRQDCLTWMAQHGYPEPPRSACRFCPFHSDDEWRRLRDDEPVEFAAAVAFEQELQVAQGACTGTAKLNGVPFLHDSLKPLGEIEFGASTAKALISRFGNECTGLCGV